jgi:hypothetical protein
VWIFTMRRHSTVEVGGAEVSDSTVRAGVLLPADHAERAALKQQVEIAAAIAAELESLLGWGDRCIGRRVTDRIEAGQSFAHSISAATIFSHKKTRRNRNVWTVPTPRASTKR